jgi:hypothetical protein
LFLLFGFVVLQSVLRNFTTVKQELKEEVTVEEHEVDSSK